MLLSRIVTVPKVPSEGSQSSAVLCGWDGELPVLLMLCQRLLPLPG